MKNRLELKSCFLQITLLTGGFFKIELTKCCCFHGLINCSKYSFLVTYSTVQLSFFDDVFNCTRDVFLLC